MLTCAFYDVYIGTKGDTAVFALEAARAGAARVFAVEARDLQVTLSSCEIEDVAGIIITLVSTLTTPSSTSSG